MNGCVLVVDDNPDVRTILSVRLTRAGFSVVTAGDGAAALEALGDHLTGCVIVDVCMPTMDGFDFLAAARQRLAALPPIFLMSQYEDDTVVDRAAQLRDAEFLPKAEVLDRRFTQTLIRRLAARNARPAVTAVPVAA
jgi:CheY-like chemotaxis protein